MRVLMISKACGVGVYQRKLEEMAKVPDVDLMVIVPSVWWDGSQAIEAQAVYTSGYTLVEEQIMFNGRYHLHFYPWLGRRMRAFGPDIVHIDEEPYNLATYHAMRTARRLGAKTLWFTWQNLNRRYPWPFRYMERYAMQNADYAIAGSDGAAAVWREKGYAGPLAVIPQFGVDPHLFSPAGDAERAGAGLVIGCAARFVPEKGIDVLLQAVAHIEHVQLWLLGQGLERERLKTLSGQLGVAARVRFMDSLPSVEMPDFYRQLDMLVLPSRSRPNWMEQFGRVLIEAMACGVPVIGSDCGEIPAVIGDAGLVFPEDDEQALRACILKMVQRPDLRIALAGRGRARVLAHFTQARVAEKTVAVYRQLIDG